MTERLWFAAHPMSWIAVTDRDLWRRFGVAPIQLVASHPLTSAWFVRAWQASFAGMLKGQSEELIRAGLARFADVDHDRLLAAMETCRDLRRGRRSRGVRRGRAVMPSTVREALAVMSGAFSPEEHDVGNENAYASELDEDTEARCQDCGCILTTLERGHGWRSDLSPSSSCDRCVPTSRR